MERTVEWVNSRGDRVVATVGIRTERLAYADGDNVQVPCCEWYERVEVKGVFAGCSIQRLAAEQKVGDIVVAGRCGNIGIPRAQMDAIDAARADLRASEVWRDREAKIEQNRRECDEYERHRAAVDHAMTLGGRTY